MRITVNGEPRELAEGGTVSQLLEMLQVVPGRVVVELNLAILKRAEHTGALLKEGDQVEIVQFVGGGSSNIRHETSDMRPQARGQRLQEPWSQVSCLRSQVS